MGSGKHFKLFCLRISGWLAWASPVEITPFPQIRASSRASMYWYVSRAELISQTSWKCIIALQGTPTIPACQHDPGVDNSIAWQIPSAERLPLGTKDHYDFCSWMACDAAFRLQLGNRRNPVQGCQNAWLLSISAGRAALVPQRSTARFLSLKTVCTTSTRLIGALPSPCYRQGSRHEQLSTRQIPS